MKSLSIEQLAEKLNGDLWTKGDLKRIYLDCGYNTKKMSTKTYVYEKEARFIVVCNVDCRSQDPAWEKSQEDSIIKNLNEQIDEIIEDFGFEIEDPRIDIEADLAAEEQVHGYYMRWHEVRVAINGYGKLAYRKRQKVHTYQGAISKTPAGFIALNDADFAIALDKEKREYLYEYGDEPNLTGEAQRINDRNIAAEKENRLAEEKRIADAAKAEDEKKKASKELADKIEAMKAQGIESPLLAWKMLGCPHPAPAEVMEAKMSSGLNWKNFQNSIQ